MFTAQCNCFVKIIQAKCGCASEKVVDARSLPPLLWLRFDQIMNQSSSQPA
jgi:hypothetical protein